jgi:hypothetical protein
LPGFGVAHPTSPFFFLMRKLRIHTYSSICTPSAVSGFFAGTGQQDICPMESIILRLYAWAKTAQDQFRDVFKNMFSRLGLYRDGQPEPVFEVVDDPQQHGGWECGLMSLECIRRTLRDQPLNGMINSMTWKANSHERTTDGSRRVERLWLQNIRLQYRTDQPLRLGTRQGVDGVPAMPYEMGGAQPRECLPNWVWKGMHTSQQDCDELVKRNLLNHQDLALDPRDQEEDESIAQRKKRDTTRPAS